MEQSELSGGPGGVPILPGLDRTNRAFWQGGETGALLIARCTQCGTYVHPPFPNCLSCGGATAAQPVSGDGKVASFTINYQKWLPAMEIPFVFAAVELAEQPELYLFTNIVGVEPEAVGIGMAVTVCFDEAGDVHLPKFRPR